MPAGAVYVGRPTKWGNPFPTGLGFGIFSARAAVGRFRSRLIGLRAIGALDLSELRGKNLACWCRLDQACHADVLLEFANAAKE